MPKKKESCESAVVTHQYLYGEKTLACITGVDGELHRQAGGNAGSVQSGTAGTDFTGIMSGQHLDLKWTEKGETESHTHF